MIQPDPNFAGGGRRERANLAKAGGAVVAGTAPVIPFKAAAPAKPPGILAVVAGVLRKLDYLRRQSEQAKNHEAADAYTVGSEMLEEAVEAWRKERWAWQEAQKQGPEGN